MADDDDLMFGEMPEDDDLNGHGHDSDVDACNDETFGGPLPSGTNYEQLEDYATQTAGLRMDDIWDTPGCSKAAPPASDLPMPSFDFTNFGSSSFDFLGTVSAQKVDNIWGESKSDSVWPEHLQTEIVKSPKMAPIGRQQEDISNRPKIPSMPQGPTLEEIEKMHQAAAKSRIPAIPSTAMSAEELEKKILQESRNQQNGQHNVPPPIPSLLGNVPSPVALGMCPPIPPMFVPCFVPWLDVLMGRAQNVPHGCPPPPPFVMALMSRFRNPSVVMGILTQAVTPTGGPPPFLPPMNQQPSQTQSPQGWQERHRKPPGMPSARTIEDLAFDQFAGYMSIKERQWLVKIQILQCQGTNNPPEDDYYYINWRHKRIAEGIQAKKDPERSETKDIINGSKQGRRNRDRQNSQSEPVDRVTALATRFSGSLGIPTKASTHNPRHSIRVQHGDPIDEEQDKRAAGHQKKLRSLLMRIESATTMLIECNDNKIALETKTMANESRSKLISGNHLMGDLVLNELIKPDFLHILQIQKGRTLFYRYFKVALPQQLLKMMQFLVEQTRTTIPQIKNIAEMEEDILSGLFEFSTSLYNHSQIGTIYDNINLPELLTGLAEKNSFARDYLLTMLAICYTVKNAKTGPLLNWVRSIHPIDLSTGFTLPDTFIWTILPGFGRGNVHDMAQWLRYKVAENSRGTVAEQIAQRLILF